MFITGFQSDISAGLTGPPVRDGEMAQTRQAVRAAKAVNDSSILGNNQLVFVVDRQTHQAIFRVVDRSTQQVVSQVPPEYVLRLAEDLGSGATKILSPGADT